MEDDPEPSSRKRRKVVSETKGLCNSSASVKSFGTSATEVLSGAVKVEESEAGSSADVGALSRELGVSWLDFLSEPKVDLLVSIKELATERLMSTGEIGLEEVLPASALQTIGMIMEELAKHHVKGWLVPSITGSQSVRTSQEDIMTQSGDDLPTTT